MEYAQAVEAGDPRDLVDSQPEASDLDPVCTTTQNRSRNERRVVRGGSWAYNAWACRSANRIDWRQSAKTQRVYIRETEWEAAQSVWLWRDNSPSMHYVSSGATETKASRATLLLLAAASLLVRGGEHIALLGRERVARSGRTALDRMTMSLIAELKRRNICLSIHVDGGGSQ